MYEVLTWLTYTRRWIGGAAAAAAAVAARRVSVYGCAVKCTTETADGTTKSFPGRYHGRRRST